MNPFQKWLVAWIVITILGVIAGLSNGEWRILYQAPLASAVFTSIVAGIYYSRGPCSGCGRRWAGVAWDHSRKDGGPDLRYKSNYQRCCACGEIRG
jgi:hypothetical protein